MAGDHPAVVIAAVVTAARPERAGRVREANRRPMSQATSPLEIDYSQRPQEDHVHIHKRLWRNVISAAAIVAFALPLTTPLATNVGAQPAGTTSNTTSSIAGAGFVTPAAAFNPIGTDHTVTFTCTGAGTGATTTVVGTNAGCFDVTASANNITTGAAANVLSGSCGASGTFQNGTKTECFFASLTNVTTTCPTGATVGGILVNATYDATTNTCSEAIGAGTTFTAANCTAAGGTADAAGTTCTLPPVSGASCPIGSFSTAGTGTAAATCTLPTGLPTQVTAADCATFGGAPDSTGVTCVFRATTAATCPVSAIFTPASGTTQATCQEPIGTATQIGATRCTINGGSATTSTCTFAGTAVVCPAGATANNSTGTCTEAIGAATISATDCVTAGGTPTPAAPATATACFFPLTASQATATINPGANDAYTVTFTGYVAPTTVGATAAATICPAGTGPAVTGTTTPGTFACPFTVTAQKKYFEITKITVSPVNSTCTGGSLTFAEGLKAFFGPTCVVTAAVSGTTVLKTGVNCTDGSEPATGTLAPTAATGGDFPVGSTYDCTGDTLSVTGIMPTSAVPVTFSVTGPGSTTCTTALGGLAAGSTSTTSVSSTSGASVSICPTGAGTVAVSACLATPLPNNQPQVCSTALSITFTENAARVVPYVRWAGEKIVLTKCFGVGLAGSTIEFTLKGNNDGLSATLLPTNLGSLTGATAGGNAQLTSGSTQVFTTADATGCASVIGYADGEGVMSVDAAVYAAGGAQSLINEHAFQVFYLKFDNVTLENINFSTYTVAQAITPYLSFLAAQPTNNAGAAVTTSNTPLLGLSAAKLLPTSFMLPGAPGTGATGFDTVPIATTQYVRAMVHGYFEYPGDPSGRPASNVSIPGATTGSAGSYVLPAGRWVLPEDWPLLATFAGFGLNGQAADFTPSSVLAWDINSGYAFNPASENPVLCGAQGTLVAPATVESGAISDFLGSGSGTNLPCFGQDGNGQAYTTAPNGVCAGGATEAPFDATQSCTDPFPLKYAPAGSSTAAASSAAGSGGFAIVPTSHNSSYLPNGTLNEWDAPMPPAQVSFGITGGPGYLSQVNKTGLYRIGFAVPTPASGTCPTGYTASATNKDCELELFPDPFYSEAIPASPLIPPTTNNGGYLWDSWGFSFGTVTTTSAAASVPTTATLAALVPCSTTTTTTIGVTAGTAAAFSPGMIVNISGSTGTGTATLSGVLVTAVNPTTDMLTLDCATLDAAFAANGAAGAFGTAAPSLALGATITARDFTLTLTSGAGVAVGAGITLINGSGLTFTSTVTAVSGNTVTVSGAQGLAAAFGTGCATGLTATGSCSIGALVSSGTTVSIGTTSGINANGVATSGGPPQAAPKNPYPFWQWVPGAPGANDQPASGTVYSDNHGEAVVALNTFASGSNVQVTPTNGTCPTGYTSINVNSSVVNCLLPYQSLTQFQNVKTLGTAAGCIATFPSGTTAAVGTSAVTIDAGGPQAGQICINNQGGLEFGTGAVLGTTTVNAVADYPYTREHAPVGSASLTKVWTSLFNKSVTVSAGTPGPAGTTAYNVTVTAQDVTGAPLLEPVEVFALGNAGAAVLAPVTYGSLISASSTSAVVTPNAASGGVATFSLEVLNTAIGTSGLVVKVVFPFEKIERFATVISGSTTGTTATVVYPPGWQQVGGPAGSNFSVAEALFTWDPTAGAYTNATASAGNVTSAGPACTGYWAYFAAAMSISLPATTASGTTQTCTLQKGWNLVGDPFGGAATIQSGVTAFHWNGTSYDTVGVIPLGGSVWIYNDGTLNTVTLTQE